MEARRWRRVDGGASMEARHLVAHRRKFDEEGASREARCWRRVNFGDAKTISQQWRLRVVASNLKRHLGNVDGRKSSKDRHRRSSNAGTSSKRRIEKKWTFKIIKRVSRQRYVAIGGTSSWECRRGNFVGGASSKECLHRKPEVVSQN